VLTVHHTRDRGSGLLPVENLRGGGAHDMAAEVNIGLALMRASRSDH